jgi:membrane-associated phospholipid phosphatase
VTSLGLQPGAADRPARQFDRFVDRRMLPVWCIVGLGCVPIAIAVVFSAFSFSDPGLIAIVAFLVALAGLGMRLRGLGWTRLGLFCEAVALLNGLGVVIAKLSAIFAATRLPYVDADLAELDAELFGFYWLEAVAHVRNSAALLNVLSLSYMTLFWQPILLVAALILLNRSDRVAVFVTAWAICLSVAVAIFPFAPALGGYLYFGIRETAMPDVLVASAWDHVNVLGALRNGTLRALSPETLEGIITFPSFHAGGAVMLAWGYWHAGKLRWPALGLNLVMLPSSIFIGGHYLVDVVAGGVIAVLSILLAHRLVPSVVAKREPPGRPVAAVAPAE